MNIFKGHLLCLITGETMWIVFTQLFCTLFLTKISMIISTQREKKTFELLPKEGKIYVNNPSNCNQLTNRF